MHHRASTNRDTYTHGLRASSWKAIVWKTQLYYRFSALWRAGHLPAAPKWWSNMCRKESSLWDSLHYLNWLKNVGVREGQIEVDIFFFVCRKYSYAKLILVEIFKWNSIKIFMSKELWMYLEIIWNWVILSCSFFLLVSTLSAAQAQKSCPYMCICIDTDIHVYVHICTHTHIYTHPTFSNPSGTAAFAFSFCPSYWHSDHCRYTMCIYHVSIQMSIYSYAGIHPKYRWKCIATTW